MRNLRILGLALVAMLAISATATSVAAAAPKLTAESYPATITGASEANNVASITAGNVSCPGSSYHGLISEPSTTLTVAFEFAGCTAFGFPGIADVNGCTLVLHGVGLSLQATLDLACPPGQELTVTAVAAGATTKCTVHIKPQTGLETVTITPIGTGATRELTLDINLSGIQYTHTAGTGIGACTSGSGSTGTLVAKTVITGEKVAPGTGHVGLIPSL
jgi:hypothetical protein